MSSNAVGIHEAFDAAFSLKGWGRILKDSVPDGFIDRIASAYAQGAVHPAPGNLFRALLGVGRPSDVRVVILGQDPYHGPGQAQGLAFSVAPGLALPPSLRNIYREIGRSCGGTPPVSGNLDHWAAQGVLLLNDVLSVREGEAHSHADLGWQSVTEAVLGGLVDRPAAFMLWGRHARAKSRIIAALPQEHIILEAPHPSPLSAHRGFIGCGHFAEVNRWLSSRGEAPIQWWPNPVPGALF